MNSTSTYDEIIKAINEIPKELLPKLASVINSFKKSFSQNNKIIKSNSGESGLCGIWADERNADEIINDIYTSRTGYGKREVNL